MVDSPNKENFLVYSLNKDAELEAFSKTNQELLKLLPKLSDISDNVFRNSVRDNREELTIFMLGRLCWRHFESILLLCMNGHGFSAIRILRTMFEKYVDLTYLHLHPEMIDDFWDYYLVQIYELDGEKAAEAIDKDYLKIISKFEVKNKKSTSAKKKRYSFKWSRMGLREKAEALSINDKLFKYSYKYTNLFIHPSPYEIMHSLILEKDITFSPVESDNNENERKLATVGLYLSMDVLIRVMDKLNQHYSFGNDQLLKDFVSEFAIAAKNQGLAG